MNAVRKSTQDLGECEVVLRQEEGGNTLMW